MDSFFQDVRYGLRVLLKSPGFSLIAIATLALGIGATTIMFAVVDAVLIRPLAYPHSEQIVHLSEAYERRPGMSIAYANLLDWQAMNHVFSSMGGIVPHALTFTGNGPAEQLEGRSVTHEFFRTLGVPPALGRDFTAQDDQPSASPTAILSHQLWRRRFNSDPAIIGRVITLDRRQYAVIGVLPHGFSYNDVVPDVFVPVGLITDPDFRQNRYAHAGTYAVARLKAGVTLEDARRDMDRVAEILQKQYPKTNARNWISVIPMREWMVGDVREPLLILLAAVGLLLLIACSNVANLLLAKGSARRREIAIRQAIGASRGRLLRQLLTESVLLAMFGGAVGVLLAYWGATALVLAAPDSLPRVSEVRVDGAVLAFTVVVAVLAGILFGILPALQAPASNPQVVLKEAERGGSSRAQQRARSSLLVAEVALSLALLAGAGLLIRSFQRVMQVEAGFNPRQLLTADIILSYEHYKSVPQAEAFFAEMMRGIRAIPGVMGASTVVPMPMSGNEWDTDYALQGMPSDQREFPNTEIGLFGPDYLGAMQIPLLAGRAFSDTDTANSLPVAIVNQAFARRNWPDQNPIGKRIRLGDPIQLTGPENADSRWRTVIGVIRDVKQYGLDRRTVPTVYTPFAQSGSQPMLRRDLVIRAAVRDPLTLTEAVRRAVSAADPEQAIADVKTMDEVLSGRLATRQLSMVLLGIFATLALLLGAVGIYGVVSYWVVQRTQEIGIRVALGARRVQVLQLILGHAATLLAVGVALGLACALALARLLHSMLFGVGDADARVFLVVTVLLAAVTGLASYIPARRATKVDPMVALRYE